ncbi:MAG: YceG family protein [Desulfosporosinus sp.]|nr:YceG family protein [Desulfosporosinus sp.]
MYFYRILGCDDERQYLAEIASLDEKLRALGNYICFDKTIHITTDASLIEQARKLFEQVPLRDFSNGALLNVLESQGYFSVTSDSKVNQTIKDAFGIILNLYLINERAVNLSIVINFITKVLLWFVDYGKQIGKKSLYNPKIIYWGSPKIHEIYFLILMSLIGCDVLVLNTSFKDSFAQVDKQNDFSLLIKKAQELPIGVFPTKQLAEEAQIGGEAQTGIKRIPSPEPGNEKNQRIPQNSSLLNDPIIVVKLKRTETILAEILVPLNKRSGYVGEPYPILPTYFVRYIGVPSSSDDWEAEYYNSLYNLDKTLQISGVYLKFPEGIPAPSATETALIPPKLITYPYKDPMEILQQILQTKILPRTYDELLDNTIRKAFADIVDLFAEKSSNCNSSIVLNFSLKLVTWLNRYLPKLFVKSNSQKKSGREGFNYEYNPKIIFYGTIKSHEIYLLYAFHKLGCDVLFVHPNEEGDKLFQNFDKNNQVTHLIKNNRSVPLVSFPEAEQLIRKSTIAYNASKEIEEVIYSEEVGLFKPWQFESYSTQPITLKTTYDELKILWREPAKLRPEFKVQNKKVYVPNLFAKINGVSEELDTYWQDLKAFSTAPNTKLIGNVPFAKISYTKQELYQTDYLLNEQGFFDVPKVMKSRHYKFGYLKGHLQHFLVVKINELLCSGMFLATVDEKFKLKIIMTILTMDDSLLKLIEVFDYPQEIPKVIVYDNEKETFTEDDAILLAYFNLIGLDVVIFTPTNYQTIEQQIKPSLLEVHQLPLVKYDLALPSLNSISAALPNKSGLLSRFFNLR